MQGKSLSEIIEGNLKRALWGLLLATFSINTIIVIYEVRTLTDNISDTFSRQLQNVARVSSQRGDMLSLQKDLEAVAAPLAKVFAVDIKITDSIANKMIVDIPRDHTFFSNLFTRTITSVLEVNPVGSLEAVISFQIYNIVFIAIMKALISSFLIIASISLIRRYVNQINAQNLAPIDRFSKWLDTIGPEAIANNNLTFPTDGLQEDLKIGLEAIAQKMSDLSSKNAQLETERTVGVLARRVAHDIRSPLSALNMLLSEVSGMTNDQRNIISQVSRRINMIANNLLESSNSRSVRLFDNGSAALTLESACLEIIQEKRVEYKNLSYINIESRIIGDISNVRVPFDPDEFKRMLSNLINNSVEAISTEGNIIIDVWRTGSRAYVRVTDNGKGIPESVLTRLTTEQISTKAQGAGIGLFSAHELLKSCGHSLTIHSKEDIGTQVCVCFNLQAQSN